MSPFLSRPQALAGAIASSEIERLPLHEQDRLVAERWAAGELTGDQAVAEVLASLQVGTPAPRRAAK